MPDKVHIVCSNCLQPAEAPAFRRLQNSFF